MDSMTYPQEGQLLVSISDVSMLKDIKKAISMLKGVTKVKAQKATSKRGQSQTCLHSAESRQSSRNSNCLSAAKREQARPEGKIRLYDPETGEYLNDETIKVIEDAHKGIGVTHYDSLQDFYKEMGL